MQHLDHPGERKRISKATSTKRMHARHVSLLCHNDTSWLDMCPYDSPNVVTHHLLTQKNQHFIYSTKPYQFIKTFLFSPFPAKTQLPDCKLHISFISWWKVAIYSLLERSWDNLQLLFYTIFHLSKVRPSFFQFFESVYSNSEIANLFSWFLWIIQAS